jgi:diguanylate cyclase (GGDEF)-like protein/PAS domain S-box-containing protein
MDRNLLDQLRYARGSLKLRLALTGIVLIGLSVAFTVFFVLRDMGERTERAILDTQIGDAERLASVLSSRLVSLQLGMRSASAEVPIDALDDPHAVITFLQNRVVLRTQFDSIFVAAPDGRLLALADSKGIRDPGINVADRAYFKQTLEQARPVVSEPIVGRVAGEPVIVLTMPVSGKRGGTAAILGCGLRLATRSLLGDLTRSGSSEYDPVTTIITDSMGRIISHPDRQWILRDAQTEPRIAAAVERWVSQGRPVEPQGSAHRVGDHVVAMAGVPDSDWVIFRTAPAEVLLGGPAAGRRQALWIGSVVALTGGGIILLATLLMLRPLRRLEQRALRLLDDDLAADEGWPQVGGELGALSKVFRHVMRQRAASQKSSAELFAKMQAVLGNAPVGIAFTRLSHFELVSAQFNRMFGHQEDQLVGQPTHLICTSEEEHQALGVRVAVAFAAARMFDEEIELVRADGSRFWGRRQGAPVRTGDISAGTIWIFTDITESRLQREQLSWTAAHDPLTDLVNRREFEARLSEQLSDRRKGATASVLFLDLDRFKAVNDSAGHAAGDELLKNIAAILTQRVRADDTVARLGGDEFAVLLRNCDRQTAERVANQICDRVQAYRLHWQGLSLQVGASIGVVQIDASLADVSAVMSASDAACYEAKRAGRNAVRSHSTSPLRLIDGTSG